MVDELICTLLKVVERESKYGDKFYYAFFKGTDGKSYRSCLYPNMRNFSKWKDLVDRYIDSHNSCEKAVLKNLVVRGGSNQIDADSYPVEIEGLWDIQKTTKQS